MNRVKFRFYPLNSIELFILENSEYIPEILTEERYTKLDTVCIPKEYWREGSYYLPHNKLSKRLHKGDLCTYKVLVYYKNNWYCHTDMEGSTVTFPFPTKEIWDSLQVIPRKYLNKEGLALLTYWERKLKLKEIKYQVLKR